LLGLPNNASVRPLHDESLLAFTHFGSPFLRHKPFYIKHLLAHGSSGHAGSAHIRSLAVGAETRQKPDGTAAGDAAFKSLETGEF